MSLSSDRSKLPCFPFAACILTANLMHLLLMIFENCISMLLPAMNSSSFILYKKRGGGGFGRDCNVCSVLIQPSQRLSCIIECSCWLELSSQCTVRIGKVEQTSLLPTPSMSLRQSISPVSSSCLNFKRCRGCSAVQATLHETRITFHNGEGHRAAYL